MSADVPLKPPAPYWLAAIIESAEDAIVSKTLDGVITSWNQGAQRLFGYEAHEVVGKHVSVLIPADHADEEPGILRRIMAGERVEHYETIRVRKDGEMIDVSLTVSPIRGAQGRIIGASKIARDITEQKRTKARLVELLRQTDELRKEAEEANRLKDEFVATISHELRTPLTAILGWMGLVRRGKLNSADTKRALETIERNARSQAQLIEDLLDISRLASGKMDLKVKPLMPASMISAAVEAIKPAAEARNISLRMIIDPNAGPVVGDPERLQQVVWNLLSNAVKFTPEDGLVEVRVLRSGSSVEITVSDNGRGIEPKFLRQVFERFSQADSSSTRASGGMGLGLSVVKGIVELHGGDVRAFSEGRGKGATFTVSLPFNESRSVTQVEQIIALSPSEPVLKCPPELVGMKILVVDDEVDTCEMVRTALVQCDAEVKVATSAAEALGQMDHWTPHVLVADLSMPEIDGYELIRQIRTRDPEEGGRIPAIALTAMARIEDRAKALAAGYQMHVAKPVELSELCIIVASLADVVIE
jgi:PAS domain S-box-containing protein